MITEKGHVRINFPEESTGFNRKEWIQGNNGEKGKSGERVQHYIMNNNLVVEVADSSNNYKIFRFNVSAASLMLTWYDIFLSNLKEKRVYESSASTTYNKEKVELILSGDLKSSDPSIKFTVKEGDYATTGKLLYNNAGKYQLDITGMSDAAYLVNAMKTMIDNIRECVKVNSPVMSKWRQETYEARQKKQNGDYNNNNNSSSDTSEFE